MYKDMFLYEITHRFLKNDYQFFDTLNLLIKVKFHKLEWNSPSKNLTKKNWNYSPNHGLHTQSLQNSVKKNNIYSKFVKCKNKILKYFFYKNHKNYRNLLSALIKIAKQKYFTNFLNENIKDIKSTWKGIKTSVPMKQRNSDISS